MKIDKRNPAHWHLLLRQGAYTLLAIVLRPFARRPGTPVVILYGHQLSGNLRALYKQWQISHAQELSIYYLSLDPDHADELAEEGVRVLRCDTLHDMFRLAQCSAMVTDHGLHAMLPLVLLSNITFIDVWHGIPFKGFLKSNFWLQRRYDEVWVSSSLMKQIYVERYGFSPARVQVMGYARTDKIFNAKDTISEFRRSLSIPDGRKLVLYAPTWQHDEGNSTTAVFSETLERFIQDIATLCNQNDATLVVRAHINATIASAARENVIFCSQKDYADTEDILLATDILVCDWSSIAFDFLPLKRPAIFLDTTPPFAHGFTLGREYRYGIVVGDMPSLSRQLQSLLQPRDNYSEENARSQQDVIERLFDESTRGEAAKNQLDRLGKLAREKG